MTLHPPAVRRRLALWLAAAALAGPPVRAMTVEVHGDTVFATGPVADDLRLFEQAVAQPGVRRVAFVNSPGGDLWTGLRVGRLIATRGLQTVVAGSCLSACSIMFMGGAERRYADSVRPGLTVVGLHGAHDRYSQRVIPELQPQIYAFYKQRMGERFNAAAMNQALYDMDDAGALLRVPDPVRASKTPPWHCRSGQTPRRNCSTLTGEDAITLGIATHRELVTLPLPPGFQPVAAVFGQTLNHPIADIEATLADIGERHCPPDAAPC